MLGKKNQMLKYIKETEQGELDEKTKEEIDEYFKEPKSTLFLGPTRSGKSFLL